TFEQFAANLLGSSEYIGNQDGYGKPENWLRGVYYDVLGRTPDAYGQSIWMNALSRGVAPSAIALAIVSSPEHYTHIIRDVYGELLRRAPDGYGTSTWLAALQGGLGISRFITMIAGSDEYRNQSGNTTGENGRGQVGGIGPGSGAVQVAGFAGRGDGTGTGD